MTFPVSVRSTKNEKVLFVKALLREHRPSKDENEFLMAQLKKTLDRANQKTIGKFAPNIPKPNLHFDEYLAIKNEFAPY